MALPTSALTFDDLILEIAVFLGINGEDAEGNTTAPDNPHDLALVKRVINNGIRMFVQDAPPNGWRWQRQLISVTFSPDGSGSTNIDNDPGRYQLPDDFDGSEAGQITYAQETFIGTDIQWADEARLRELRAETTQTVSYPYLAAIREYGVNRYELIVYPNPSDTDTIEFITVKHFNTLVNGTDRHPAGFKFDEVIIAACKARAEMEVEDLAGSGWFNYYKSSALPNAMKIDERTAPRRLGKLRRSRVRRGAHYVYPRPARYIIGD